MELFSMCPIYRYVFFSEFGPKAGGIEATLTKLV